MNAKDTRNGIDLCMSNGMRLFDEAETLYKKKRYHTSIPLYILAYEEFGKAKYLCNNFVMGKEVEDSAFEKLSDSASAHTRKILVGALAFRQMLESESDEQNADYHNGNWLNPKRFNENRLHEVCKYLHHEVIRVFYDVRTNLFFYANRISADTTNLTDDQIRQIRENTDFQARLKLDQIYCTPVFLQILAHSSKHRRLDLAQNLGGLFLLQVFFNCFFTALQT
jgi:AbiV family abortive infection protein